jgi:hypothetical protein
MVCGEEMRLVQTVPDETMLVPGFEHHTLNCPRCHDEERRLVFIRQPELLSPPTQNDGIDQDFLDATLQPIGETVAAYDAQQVLSRVRSAGTLLVERMRVPLPSLTNRSSKTRSARAANSSVWDRRAALHRARWKALCDRLGLRVAGGKADVSREE